MGVVVRRVDHCGDDSSMKNRAVGGGAGDGRRPGRCPRC